MIAVAEPLAGVFSDPFDPRRSLQLNNRYWPDARYGHLDLLRDTEDALARRRWPALRRNVRHVKALLPPAYHRVFLARLVYSVLFTTTFAPIRFRIPLSQAFIDANTSDIDPERPSSTGPARATEELRYVSELARTIYRDHYGRDVFASDFAVRHVRAVPEISSRMTKYGDASDYHFDEGKDFTCIVYLCDVDTDNGAFSYLDQTWTIPKSHVLRALHQVVGNYMGLSLPEQTAQLPLELRGSMALGNFIDDAKRERLREARVDVRGGAGEGIVFNGFDMLHRGGTPQRGRRSAVFISTRGVVSSRLRNYAGQLVAYLCL